MSDRPRLRPDLVLVEQTYRGEQSYILKDPTTHKYFRFRPVEIAVMQSLDGERTVAEAALALAENGIRVSAAARRQVRGQAEGDGSDGADPAGALHASAGEAQGRAAPTPRHRSLPGRAASNALVHRRSRQVSGSDDAVPAVLLHSRVPAGVCGTLRRLLRGARESAGPISARRWPTCTDSGSARATLPSSTSPRIVVIAIHELGHAYTCKYFGGKVHEMGAMLIYFEPAFFCNVNDAWTFPELRARIWVTAAGSWIQMVVASLAAIVWWAAAPGTLVSEVALAAVVIGGFTTVLMNVNPLIPLDGYYALSDWLEVPNLRQRSFAHLTWLIKAKLLRLDVPAPPADEREQRIFTIYSLLAAGYICSIFLFIGAAVYGWIGDALGVARHPSVRRRGAGGWHEIRSGSGPARFSPPPGRSRRGCRRVAGGGRWSSAGVLALLGALVPCEDHGHRAVHRYPRFLDHAGRCRLGAGVRGSRPGGCGRRPGATLVRLRNLDLERTVAARRASAGQPGDARGSSAVPRPGRRGRATGRGG